MSGKLIPSVPFRLITIIFPKTGIFKHKEPYLEKNSQITHPNKVLDTYTNKSMAFFGLTSGSSDIFQEESRCHLCVCLCRKPRTTYTLITQGKLKAPSIWINCLCKVARAVTTCPCTPSYAPFTYAIGMRHPSEPLQRVWNNTHCLSAHKQLIFLSAVAAPHLNLNTTHSLTYVETLRFQSKQRPTAYGCILLTEKETVALSPRRTRRETAQSSVAADPS